MTTIPYIHFTDEQKQRAATVDLPEFLRRQGEKLLPSGREYQLDSDHSITLRASSWYDHAAGRGGPISFMQNFYDLSYPEAVSRLLGGEQGSGHETMPKQKEHPKTLSCRKLVGAGSFLRQGAGQIRGGHFETAAEASANYTTVKNGVTKCQFEQ